MFDFAAHERAQHQHKEAFAARFADEIARLPLNERTAKVMAHTALAICCDQCVAEGMDPNSEVFMRTPDESHDYMGGTPGIYIVSWESGPYTWGISASMGIVMAVGKLVETHYGFDLCFYPGED